MTDMEVAEKLYSQHGSNYEDMSKSDFFKKFGVPLKEKTLADNVPFKIRNAGNVNVFNESPLKLSEGVSALGRGVLDVGQGLKQAIGDVGEHYGALPPGTVKSYTEEANKGREEYAATPAGKSLSGQFLRESPGTLLPAFLGMPSLGAESMLARMMWGAGGGAAHGATKYLEEPEARRAEILKDSMIGLAVPPALSATLKAMQLPEVISLLKNKVDLKDLIKYIQSGHDMMKSGAIKLFNEVRNGASKANISNLPLTQKLTDILDKSKEYMPNSKAVTELYNKAKSGSYDAIHKWQSSLGDRIRKLKSSKNIAEQDLGETLNDHREDLIDHVKDYFTTSGHPELASKLQEARQEYAKLHDIYYPKKAPAIGRIVHEDTRAMPKNPESFLRTESKPMETLFNQHPEIPEQLARYDQRQQLIDRLKFGGKAALGGLSLYGAYGLGSNIMNSLEGND